MWRQDLRRPQLHAICAGQKVSDQRGDLPDIFLFIDWRRYPVANVDSWASSCAGASVLGAQLERDHVPVALGRASAFAASGTSPHARRKPGDEPPSRATVRAVGAFIILWSAAFVSDWRLFGSSAACRARSHSCPGTPQPCLCRPGALRSPAAR